MGWLAKLLGLRLSRDQFQIPDAQVWELCGRTDLPTFVRSLPDLLPPQSCLVLEDPCSREVRTLLESIRLRCPLPRLEGGENDYHLGLGPDSVQAVADLLERFAVPEVCVHMHAHLGDRVLMTWYDVSPARAGLFLALDVPEERVAAFCRTVGLRYGRIGPNSA